MDEPKNNLEAPTPTPKEHPITKLLKTKHALVFLFALITLLLVAAVVWIVFMKDDSKQAVDQTGKKLSLAETGYTGVAGDVISKDLFDCKPRTDHEWYRTDRTLTVDFKDPNVMYVNVEYKGLFKTTDGGKTWVQKTKGIKVYGRKDDPTKGCYSEYPVIRMDPSNNKHLILGTSSGGGGFLNPTTPNSQTGGVYQTYDGGEHWKLMINDKMDTYVNDIAIDPNDPKTVYYSTSSTPQSYQGADQNKLFVTKGLVYQTKDSGKNWVELPTGIGHLTGAQRVLINPANSKEILVPTFSAVRESADGSGTGLSTGKDTSIAQMGILKTTDGGTTWSTLQLPGNPAISHSYVSPTNFKHMFFAQQGTNGQPYSFVTLDGATFLKTQYMDVVAYDPYDASGNHMLGYSTVASTPTIPNHNLFESKDGGKTWAAYGGLPSEITDLNDPQVRPSALFWNATDKNTLYMSGAGGHVWKSADLGKTWTTLLDYTKLPK